MAGAFEAFVVGDSVTSVASSRERGLVSDLAIRVSLAEAGRERATERVGSLSKALVDPWRADWPRQAAAYSRIAAGWEHRVEMIRRRARDADAAVAGQRMS